MSAVITRRRGHRAKTRDRDTGRQPSLFGQLVSPPPPSPPETQRSPVAEPRAPREETAETGTATLVAPPTLDETMSVLWASLSASSPAACPVCGATMLPRHSAGAGVVGGRCGGCGTTVE
jgi:hypothetical protein